MVLPARVGGWQPGSVPHVGSVSQLRTAGPCWLQSETEADGLPWSRARVVRRGAGQRQGVAGTRDAPSGGGTRTWSKCDWRTGSSELGLVDTSLGGPAPAWQTGQFHRGGPPQPFCSERVRTAGLEGTPWSWCREGEEDWRPGGLLWPGQQIRGLGPPPSPDVCCCRTRHSALCRGPSQKRGVVGQAERSQGQPRAHPQAPRGQGVSSAEASPVASDAGFRARMSPGRGRQVQGHPVSWCPRCWACGADGQALMRICC